MKKIISTIAALTLCFSTFTVVSTSAAEQYYYSLDFSTPVCMVKSEELSGIEEYSDVYYSINTEAYPITEYVFAHHDRRKDYSSYSTYIPIFGQYNNLSDEECELLLSYLSENYPEFSAEITEATNDTATSKIVINFSDSFEYTVENLIQFSVEIYENTGIMFSRINTMADIFDMWQAGDINMDERITVEDAALTLSQYAQTQSDPNYDAGELGILCDYNADGKVTPSDAAGILEYYADKQTKQ